MVCPTLRQNLTPWWKPRHARDKPPYSYAALIAHALLSSEHGQLKLKEIYSWISHTYPYYVIGISGWQNSIRHNLSLKKKQFVRLPAKKGGYWKLAKGAEKEFIQILAHPSGRNKRVNKDVPPFIGRDTTFMPMDITVPEDYQSENRHISPPSSSLSPTLSATYWLDFQDTGKINSSPALTPDDSLTPDSSFWTQNDQSTYWLDFQDNHASIPDDMSNPVPFFWTPDYCNDMTGFDQYFSFDD
ncbi:hypothetical protein BC941DRAFT_474918 [Chlamydoabsidia padenii]|nr:hypothetical protein BC941DRAFT_474918 [Chlamydoabsidia padenii]